MNAKHWASVGVAAIAALGLKFILPGDVIAQQAPAAAAQGVGIDAEALFQQRCRSCHEPATDRAPDRVAMRQRPPAEIADVLTRGVMAPMAAGLSADQIAALAAHLGAQAQSAAAGGGRGGAAAGGGRGPAVAGWNPTITDQMCATHPKIQKTATSWTSWGGDAANTRFQKNPGLKPADVPKLKVKWAYSIKGGSYGQPTVVGDWLFITSRGGQMYALDAKTGCVHWKVDGVTSRTTPMVEYRPGLSPSGWITFVGERTRVVAAIDAQDGKVLWRSEPLESHPAAGITGSPILYGDQLFVPLTSGEEGSGASPNYQCCSFRGSVAAVDIKTGKKLWQTSVINEPMKPTRKSSAGTQLQGPAGGAIWSAPTIDAKRKLVLVATGDSYTDAHTDGADAIVAMEMATGKIRWMTQVTAGDNFIVGCTRVGAPANCPAPPGPDFDFGASPIVKTLANGKGVVLSGQKSGIAYGMDADTGKLLWKNAVGAGSSLGGIEWGMAMDDKYLYVPNADTISVMEVQARKAGKSLVLPQFFAEPKPGLTAIDPATGKTIWHTPTPEAPCKFYGDRSRDRAQGCFNASSAAATVIPGAVFSGSLDGWMRAYDPATGKIIWAFSTTAQTYDTVNGVKGQPGGSIDAMGPVVSNGSMYTMSGYNGSASVGGNGTNVLLAFSVDGK